MPYHAQIVNNPALVRMHGFCTVRTSEMGCAVIILPHLGREDDHGGPVDLSRAPGPLEFDPTNEQGLG